MAFHPPVRGRGYGSGLSQEDWLGNAKADEAAKAHARAMDISPLVLSKWAENQAAVEAVCKSHC